MQSMKTKKVLWGLVTVLMLAWVVLPAVAERGDDSKRKSKNGKVEGTVDGVAVTVEYGRPKVKDRTVWDALVPYGKVWRTGADEATTITLGQDAMIQGQKLAAGTYSLFTIPGETEWTVIFNSVAEQWGAYSYDESKDVLRVTAKPVSAEHQEELDFVIVEDGLHFRWAELALPITVASAG